MSPLSLLSDSFDLTILAASSVSGFSIFESRKYKSLRNYYPEAFDSSFVQYWISWAPDSLSKIRKPNIIFIKVVGLGIEIVISSHDTLLFLHLLPYGIFIVHYRLSIFITIASKHSPDAWTYLFMCCCSTIGLA